MNTFRRSAPFATAFVVMVSASSCRNAEAEAARHAADVKALRSNISATEACEELVSRQLTAPASAKFHTAADGDSTVEVSVGGNAYVVTGTVDSQNGFGAMLRSTFSCQMQKDTVHRSWSGMPIVTRQ